MRILLINGSPKGSRSNTLRLSMAFLEGLSRMEEMQLRELTVSQLQISSCLGCFACWNKTPGKCCIQDDMSGVIESILWAELIIWSFPLYYFSVPGGMKTLIDRQLPMVLPFMTADSASGGHPARYDQGEKRHVLISTCGFHTAEGNYDGVVSLFDHLCGAGKYEKIFCGQGELFRVKELTQRTDEYLSCVLDAGMEYARGGITQKTRAALNTPLYPRAVFEAMADASWGVEATGERTEESLIFTRQMAALYAPSSWNGKNLVLEMAYTDIGKCYQILLEKEGSRVITDGFLPYTTRIETSYSLWQSIAAGEISGQDALMQQKYRVLGDFDLMIHWDRYFGAGNGAAETKHPASSTEKGTDMRALLLPWIVFWIAAAIDGFYGPLITLLCCAAVPFLFFRNRKTFYDALSCCLAAVFSVGMLLGLSAIWMICGSYLAFGVMWSVSCLLPVPLTAWYSMTGYGGEEALDNPLFVQTNRILTGCWGVLYLLTPVWTYFIMGTAASSWVGAINSVLPALMGVFTAWFQKWYPAAIARGNIQKRGI